MKRKLLFVSVLCAFLSGSVFAVKMGLNPMRYKVKTWTDSQMISFSIASVLGVSGILYAGSAAAGSMHLLGSTDRTESVMPRVMKLSAVALLGMVVLGGAAPVEPPEGFLCPSSRKLKERETEEPYPQKSFNINHWLASDPLGLITDIGYLRRDSEFVFQHQPDFVNSSLVADSGIVDSYATVSLNRGDNLYHIKGSLTQLIQLDKVPFSEPVFLKRQSAYLLQQGQDSMKLLYINQYYQATVCSY